MDAMELQNIEEQPYVRFSGKTGHNKMSIFKRLYQKECNTYVEDLFCEQNERCQCGRDKSKHEYISDEAEWTSSKHTAKTGTQAYGKISMVGSGYQTRAKFVRLADDTDYEQIWELLTNTWQLEIPDMVISIAGAAANSNLSGKSLEWFKQGVRKMTSTKRAWVFTGGTKCGIYKHTVIAQEGSMNLRSWSTSSYCIGVTPWGIVDQRENMIGATRNHTIEDTEPIPYYVKSGAKGNNCLSSHHGHFLLIDNGTENTWWTEIQTRIKLVSEMRYRIAAFKDLDNIYIPALCIVVGGGAHVIQMVKEYVCQDPPIPVVVLKGSGKAPELLCLATSLCIEVKDINDEDLFIAQDQLIKKIQDIFFNKDKNEQMKIFEDLVICSEKRRNIMIVDQECADLDIFIFESLVKYYKGWPAQQLDIALCWDAYGYAQKNILTFDHTLNQSVLEKALMYCLENNRPEFTELLLSEGIVLCRFLTKEILFALYQKRKRLKTNSPLFSKKYKKVVLSAVGPSIAQILEEFKVFLPNSNLTVDSLKDKDMPVPSPHDNLFIWAILSDMPEIAKTLWKFGPNPLARTIIGYFLTKMEASVEQGADNNELVKETMHEFEEISLSLLNDCSSSSETMTHHLLTVNLSSWGRPTCLSLAAFAGQQRFLAHPACQSLLGHVWYDALKFYRYHSIKIFLGIIFPAIIPFYSYLSEEEISLPLKAKHNCLRGRNDLNGNSKHVPDTSRSDSRQRKRRHSDMSSIPFLDTLETHPVRRRKTILQVVRDIMRCYRSFYKAPITKYWIHLFFYIAFLILFAYVALVKLPEEPSVIEWILLVWIIALANDEIRQVVDSEASTTTQKFSNWKEEKWNKMDILAIILFFVAFRLRFDHITRIAANIVYAFDCMIWIVRILERFRVEKYLGPYVIMIARMIVDMIYFSAVLGIFLLAYAVVKNAILEPYADPSWGLIHKVFYIPYLEIFGNTFIESSGSENQTVFNTKMFYKGAEILGIVALDIYLLVANLLLLNLLIAVFNNTYGEIQANSKVLWKHQRYDIIMDYAKRPFLPPPFVIISNTYRFCRAIVSYCCCRTGTITKYPVLIIPYMNEEECNNMSKFETRAVVNFTRRLKVPTDRINQQTTLETVEWKQMSQEIRDLKHLLNSMQNEKKYSLQYSHNRKKASISDMRHQNDTNVSESTVSKEDFRDETTEQGKSLHKRALLSPYMKSGIKRAILSAEKIPWETEVKNYCPPKYTAPVILAAVSQTDPEILEVPCSLHFNQMDGLVNRLSSEGEYAVRNGYPCNPKGRTGLAGRGILGRWGPNHCVKYALTRSSKLDRNHGPVAESSFLTEILLVEKGKSGFKRRWIPKEPGKGDIHKSEVLKEAIKPNLFEKSTISRAMKNELREKCTNLFNNSKMLAYGYEDDARNTDNAWIETDKIWIHDNEGSLFRYISNQENEAASSRLVWTPLEQDMDITPEDDKFISLIMGQVQLLLRSKANTQH